MTWTNEEWAEKLREVPPRTFEKHEWPVGIRPISLDENGLGVDSSGTLYWHLKPVAMRVKLRWYELLLATAATLATVAQAIAAFVSLYR